MTTPGRVTVRRQITEWIAPYPPVVDLLNAVIPYPPKVTLSSEFDLGTNNGSGVIAYIHLDNQHEKRIAFGGPHNGRKWRTYDCVMLCILRSAKDQAEDAGYDNDVFLDSLADRIHADRNFGTSASPNIPVGAIFQAAEGSDVGGDDLEVNVGLPHTTRNQLIEIISTVKFQVCQVLAT